MLSPPPTGLYPYCVNLLLALPLVPKLVSGRGLRIACGSFTNIRGGNQVQYLVRSNERKDIKVFLQSGERDADIILGSWPLANQTLAASLDYAGYDFRFEFGTGGHNLRHGGSMFAETLRWLWNKD